MERWNAGTLGTLGTLERWDRWNVGTLDDGQFGIVFEAIRQLLEEDAKPKRRIGF